MPTDEQNTAELNPEQKKLLEKLSASTPQQGYGLPMGGKDPANPHPHMKEGRDQPEDKQW
jgi:hypothetical protein